MSNVLSSSFFFQSRYAHFIKDSKSGSCRPASVALHATNMQEVKAKGELRRKKNKFDRVFYEHMNKVFDMFFSSMKSK